MVRTQQKPPSEDKKETTTKKKATQKKKSVETGVWPCKINGCNKQFAREADLKRHQRTTKLHSLPGFACPQCDATFTRTDALRRHQKSRHNGVIIEPLEHEKTKPGIDDEARSSGSKSKSRSTTPSKRLEQASGSATSQAATLVQPGTAGPAGGPSSYYRQHTMETTFAPPQGMVMDAQYSQGLGLPTSATRLNEASWAPPPWGDGTASQIGPISYHIIPGRHPPSRYYRTNHRDLIPNYLYSALTSAQANGLEPPMYVGPPMQNPNSSRSGTPHTQSANVDPRLSQPDSNSNQPGSDVEMKEEAKVSDSQRASVAPVIDPSLDTSSVTPPPKSAQGNEEAGPSSSKAVSLEITQAAMEAVLESAKRESSLARGASSNAGTPDGNPESKPGETINGHNEGQVDGISSQRGSIGASGSGDGDGEADADGDADEDHLVGRASASHETDGHKDPHGYEASRPPPMEHMLTEDGEPMLNPAELLTQESLASPPPS